MTVHHAVATRGERYWLVHIPEIDKYTQARSLDEVEPMARDLVALWLDVPTASIHLESEVRLPEDVSDHLERAAKHADDAIRAQSEAASERRAAARALKARGLTVRDIGRALGVSHQRAQQLVAG